MATTNKREYKYDQIHITYSKSRAKNYKLLVAYCDLNAVPNCKFLKFLIEKFFKNITEADKIKLLNYYNETHNPTQLQ
jgi:hypothetical protein